MGFRSLRFRLDLDPKTPIFLKVGLYKEIITGSPKQEGNHRGLAAK